MPIVNINSISSSVSYAETIVDKIINEEIIYSFFLGNVESSTKAASSEERRRDVYKDASFFKKIPTSDISVVVDKNDFTQKSFNTWSSDTDVLENFYCYHNGNVYLVIGNNQNNTVQEDGRVAVSVAASPTHTWGIEKQAGYEYLFLFSTLAEDAVVLSNNIWIPVPKTSLSLSYYNGSLIHKKIDIDVVSSINFTYDNPTIPILSDTGSDASITLVTIPTTKAGTTVSQRKHKIIGIQASPGLGYEDFDLGDSLESTLPNETAATRLAIENAITLGFAPIELTARKILQANHTLLTAIVTADEIRDVTDQTQFFGHGLVEGLKTSTGSDLFQKGAVGSDAIKTNNIVIVTPTTKVGGGAETRVGAVSSILAITTGATTHQKGKVASSKTAAGSTINTEVQVNKNKYEAGDAISADKGSTVFIVTSVTEPEAKEGTGSVINIADTNFSISGDGSPGDHFPKTFVTQYLNRYN